MIHCFQTKTFLAITVFCLLLSFVFVAQAQQYNYIPFPDSNAVWSEVYWKPVSEPCPRWVYNKFALFNEDTVINSIPYHKLFSCNSTVLTREKSVCMGLLREDSLKKVWFKPNSNYIFPNTNENGEYLLYDFSLNTGDTVHCYDAYLQFLGSDILVLDSTKYINFNNSFRKVFYFNRQHEIWIEGIGKTKGIIYPSGSIPINGEWSDLICFHQNNSLIYYNSDYDSCIPSFVIDGVPLLINSNVKVYPNPASNGIVYFENLDFETLELFDIKGNLINKENITGLTIFELKTSCLPPGIYSYQLKTKGLVPTMGKLVIL